MSTAHPAVRLAVLMLAAALVVLFDVAIASIHTKDSLLPTAVVEHVILLSFRGQTEQVLAYVLHGMIEDELSGDRIVCRLSLQGRSAPSQLERLQSGQDTEATPSSKGRARKHERRR